MATIRPFKGLRYTTAAGDLQNLVAPPYDVISPEQREGYAQQSQFNVVMLTLPEQEQDDRSKFVKYSRSASRLASWRKTGEMEAEAKPAFYRYRQTFSIPGSAEKLERLALISLIKVEPYENGVVLPHEQTFPKHKEDRLRILEATRSHLECIFGLYDDDDKSALGLVTAAAGTPVADVTSEDGVRHILEVIDDEATIEAIASALASRKVWIADGHHRYETAMTFRQMLGERDGEVPEDYMMMALTSMTDPGLVLLPTHRILKTMPGDAATLREKLGSQFEVEEAANASLMEKIESVAANGGRAFGIALPGGTGLVAKVKNLEALEVEISGEGSSLLKTLDVTILHDYIFGKLLGLSGLDFFGYTRDEHEAIEAVENGAPASFLMTPPTVDDMRHIALGGEKMPQKSTFYYPKIQSGLVLWQLADF
jgi:uncharacterized protein (DUF1015 family)